MHLAKSRFSLSIWVTHSQLKWPEDTTDLTDLFVYRRAGCCEQEAPTEDTITQAFAICDLIADDRRNSRRAVIRASADKQKVGFDIDRPTQAAP